ISDFGGGVSGSETQDRGGELYRRDLYRHESYTGRASSIFFDAHFVQLSIGHFTSTGSARGSNENALEFPPATSPSGLEFALLGKFPIELSPAITVFPLAGIAYRLVLSGLLGRPEFVNITTARDLSLNPFYLSALWFRLGGGMDFALAQGMFLRSTVTYGIRLRNRWENSIIDLDEIFFPGGNFHYDRRINYDNARLGHGVDITVGVGFRLR
ncbi:MAG: hypothetical protein FWG66_13235, partial [Spirochaetes bacterium]|nr:hypothetical protein [Spirochaetota bacterium]